MDEELKAKLQAMIDHDYELAEKLVEVMKSKYGIKSDLNDTLCRLVCYDLAREFGLDLKGAIPE